MNTESLNTVLLTALGLTFGILNFLYALEVKKPENGESNHVQKVFAHNFFLMVKVFQWVTLGLCLLGLLAFHAGSLQLSLAIAGIAAITFLVSVVTAVVFIPFGACAVLENRTTRGIVAFAAVIVLALAWRFLAH